VACRWLWPAADRPVLGAGVLRRELQGGVTPLGVKVFTFGDAPGDGDMSGTNLNGPIIAASGS
jgi:hypothetical protein